MRKLILLTVCVCFCSFLFAGSTTDLEAIKARHIELIKQHGDVEFLDGQHAVCNHGPLVSSIFRLAKSASIYTKFFKAEVYRVVKLDFVPKEGMKLTETLKLHQEGRTNTFVYSLTGSNKEDMFWKASVDRATDLGVDYGTIMTCLVKVVLPKIAQCILEKQDIWNCLNNKLIEILPELLQCVGFNLYDDASRNSERKLYTKTVSWTFTPSKIWVYEDLSAFCKSKNGTIIGFDGVKVTGGSGVMGYSVHAEVTGNNVVKVYASSITWWGGGSSCYLSGYANTLVQGD